MKIIQHPCYTQHVTHLLTVLFVVVGDFGHGGFHYSPLSGCFLELSGCSRSYALCFRPDYLNAASFATFAIVIASIGTGSTCYWMITIDWRRSGQLVLLLCYCHHCLRLRSSCWYLCLRSLCSLLSVDAIVYNLFGFDQLLQLPVTQRDLRLLLNVMRFLAASYFQWLLSSDQICSFSDCQDQLGIDCRPSCRHHQPHCWIGRTAIVEPIIVIDFSLRGSYH